MASDDRLRITIGQITAGHSTLEVALSIFRGDGIVSVQTSGQHCLLLTSEEWERFKALVAAADERIGQLRQAQKLTVGVEGFGLADH